MTTRHDNPEAIAKAFKSALRLMLPPPDLLPSEWAERNVRIPVGNAVPGLIRFDNAPYQREPLDMMVNPDCYRITMMWAAQVGKALSIDTVIPTPSGFTTMMDIREGDYVLDDAGEPCLVTHATDVMHDRECYKLVFDDKTEVVCDAEHLWTVVDRGHKIRGKLTAREITLTVGEMLEPHARAAASGRTRYAVRNSSPAKHAPRDLPIDPYLYGVWLGDGSVGDGQITLHRDDMQLVDLIAGRGHSCFVRYRDKRHPNTASCRVICADGEPLSKKLRVSGLATKDSVSSDYLLSSVDDRRAMLAGLMDTDGHIANGGHTEFINKSKVISDAVAQLAASLGIKPRIRKVTKSCLYMGERKSGEYWKVSFRAYAEDHVFSLARKQEAVMSSECGKKYMRLTESRQRGIVEITKVDSVPVRCIQVDSPSRLYLCTDRYIPTHNTQVALCGQGYHIAMRPMSQMMMQPSQTDLQVWLNSKFNPMVDANPEIRARLATPRGRDGVNNSSMKSYPGGFMMFAWSGSPKTMRGRSAPLIIADEVDGYDGTGEGHPVSLLWQRAATFGDQRKLVEISTPTIKGASYIEAAFDAGDRRRFWVPCQHCGEHQVLTWERVVWDGRDTPTGPQRPGTAKYACEHCGALMSDGERKAAIRAGEWRAEMPFTGHASYHINEMYSTFRRLQDIVQSYLDRVATDDLQTFVNVTLAQTWEETGEQADTDSLMSRAEEFRAQVPAGGLVLTAGVDMQQDRLELEVVAWGHGEESWSVDYMVLWGDPLQHDVWDELEDVLSSAWQHESGAQLQITATCVDTGGTGGYTQAAYEWLRGKTGRRIFGTKGVSGWGRPVVSSPSRKQSGKTVRKVDLFLVGVDEAKLTVMRRLAVQAPGPGYCHTPKDRGAEWYQQIAAEKLVTRHVNGAPVREWHQIRDRNEAFDCRVLAFAALKIANPSFKRAAENLEGKHAAPHKRPARKAEPVAEQLPEDHPADAPAPRPRRNVTIRPKRNNWVNNW